ncbi:Fic family protein [Desemzia sp. FAM 24101]|uniref:Fic family protein n=1 Tax=unclassified Desemzia TaxID=2685243 RepID=UPI0038865108
MNNLQYRLDNAKTSDDKLLAVLDTHIQFEQIHSFSDGNGRTGRMIMMYSLL